MRKIDTIIFDLGGVLIDVKSDKEWLEEDLLPIFHHDKFEHLFTNNFFKHFETGKVSAQDFIQKLKSIALDRNCTSETILMHWNGLLKEIPKERIDLLKRLKEKYKLLLISNTDELHLQAVRKYISEKFGKETLEDYFHHCYYSFKIGLRKPHKEIYEWVIQKEQLQVSSCLYLDDKSANLVEPSKLGMPTLWVDREVVQLLEDY